MYSSDSPAEFCRTSPSNSSTSFMVPEGPLFHRTKIRCSTTKNMESERLKSDVAQGNITSPSNSPRSNHSSVNNSQDYNYIPLNGGRNRSKWSPGYGKRSWTPESLKRDSPFHGFSPRRERLYYPSPRGNMRFNQRSRNPSFENSNHGHSSDIRLYVSPRFLEDPWQHLYKLQEEKLKSEASSS